MQERSHLEFAPDGFAYCDECVFFGMNKQCAKCRMYVPFQELQQYKSGWYCPYCIMDMRAEDNKFEKTGLKNGSEKPIVAVIEKAEHCERCDKVLERRFYLLNGIKMCKSCMEIERPKIKGFDKMEAQKLIFRAPEKKASVVNSILEKIGFRKKPKTREIIVIAPKAEFIKDEIQVQKEINESDLEEKVTMKKTSVESSPQVEGIMKKKKKFIGFKTKTDRIK